MFLRANVSTRNEIEIMSKRGKNQEHTHFLNPSRLRQCDVIMIGKDGLFMDVFPLQSCQDRWVPV